MTRKYKRKTKKTKTKVKKVKKRFSKKYRGGIAAASAAMDAASAATVTDASAAVDKVKQGAINLSNNLRSFKEGVNRTVKTVTKKTSNNFQTLEEGLTPFLYKPPATFLSVFLTLMYEIGYASTFTIASLLSIPFESMDQFIPPKICEKMFNSKDYGGIKVCENKILDFALYGITEKPKLIPKISSCLSTKGSHVVACGQTGGGETGGEDKTNHYQIVLDRLIKLNLFLKKYIIPRTIIQKMIENTHNIELLTKMIVIYNYFTQNTKNYRSDKITDEERTTQCDKELKETTVEDTDTYKILKEMGDDNDSLIELHYDNYNKIKPGHPGYCGSCGEWTQFLNILSPYINLMNTSIFGEPDNDIFIIVRIIYDVILPKLNKPNSNSENINTLSKNIGSIFKNINCRSNILQLMEDRLSELNS